MGGRGSGRRPDEARRRFLEAVRAAGEEMDRIALTRIIHTQ
jgi:hypothetical protein